MTAVLFHIALYDTTHCHGRSKWQQSFSAQLCMTQLTVTAGQDDSSPFPYSAIWHNSLSQQIDMTAVLFHTALYDTTYCHSRPRWQQSFSIQPCVAQFIFTEDKVEIYYRIPCDGSLHLYYPSGHLWHNSLSQQIKMTAVLFHTALYGTTHCHSRSRWQQPFSTQHCMAQLTATTGQDDSSPFPYSPVWHSLFSH